MRIRVRRRFPATHHRTGLVRSAQWGFLVLGLAAVGVAGYDYAARSLYQEYEVRRLERAIASRGSSLAPPGKPAAPLPGAPAGADPVIGRMAIPRLDISAVIKEGVDPRTLRLAAGHFPFTALPGQPGNIGVAAHRDTLFRNLKDVRLDDEIALTAAGGAEYSYRVDSIKVVEPVEVSVLASAAGQNTLTLVTCYPFYWVGGAPKRFVVRAVQARATQASAAMTPGLVEPGPAAQPPPTITPGAAPTDFPDMGGRIAVAFRESGPGLGIR